jgi:hypothetical protein
LEKLTLGRSFPIGIPTVIFRKNCAAIQQYEKRNKQNQAKQTKINNKD